MRRSLLILFLLICIMAPLTAFDFPYNVTYRMASDITTALSLVSPALILTVAPPADYLMIATSYSATIGTSFTTRTLIKQVVDKPRPYVGDWNAPVASKRDNQSFPSGHSLMAFSAAAYTQTMQQLFYRDSSMMKGLTVATWTFALSTSVLGALSGMHDGIDIAAGAAIGSALGYLGPYVTYQLRQRDQKAPQVLVGPTIGMSIGF